MADEKKELKEEVKKSEEVVEKSDKISEDDLLKTLKELEDIAKASKEAPPEPEEEEEEEEEEEKSFTDNFSADETLEKAIEVSDFLESLVEQTETSLDGMGKTITHLTKSMETFEGKYIEGLQKIGEMIKGVGTQLSAFDERLKTIEQTPVGGPKSVTKSVQAIEKSFAGADPADVTQMPRRKVIEALEKAVVDGKVEDKVLIAFEADSSFPLPEKVRDIVKSYCG